MQACIPPLHLLQFLLYIEQLTLHKSAQPPIGSDSRCCFIHLVNVLQAEAQYICCIRHACAMLTPAWQAIGFGKEAGSSPISCACGSVQ